MSDVHYGSEREVEYERMEKALKTAYELSEKEEYSKLDSDIETVFMMTSSEFSYVSSSSVKQVAKFGGNIEGLVPKELISDLMGKF